MARFNGSDYVPGRDNDRLDRQMGRVWNLMKDGKRRSLADIAATTQDSTASISAQLRHLRKERFGSHVVEKEYEGDGLYLYRVIPNVQHPLAV